MLNQAMAEVKTGKSDYFDFLARYLLALNSDQRKLIFQSFKWSLSLNDLRQIIKLPNFKPFENELDYVIRSRGTEALFGDSSAEDVDGLRYYLSSFSQEERSLIINSFPNDKRSQFTILFPDTFPFKGLPFEIASESDKAEDLHEQLQDKKLTDGDKKVESDSSSVSKRPDTAADVKKNEKKIEPEDLPVVSKEPQAAERDIGVEQELAPVEAAPGKDRKSEKTGIITKGIDLAVKTKQRTAKRVGDSAGAGYANLTEGIATSIEAASEKKKNVGKAIAGAVGVGAAISEKAKVAGGELAEKISTGTAEFVQGAADHAHVAIKKKDIEPGQSVEKEPGLWFKMTNAEGYSVQEGVISLFNHGKDEVCKNWKLIAGSAVLGAATRLAVGSACLAGLTPFGSFIWFPIAVTASAGGLVCASAGLLRENKNMKNEGVRRLSKQGAARFIKAGVYGLGRGLVYGSGGAAIGAIIAGALPVGVLAASHSLWAAPVHAVFGAVGQSVPALNFAGVSMPFNLPAYPIGNLAWATRSIPFVLAP